MTNFWWGQRKEEKRIRWISWKKMCETKGNGGMGFKDLQTFNMTLVAKQSWKIMIEEDSLLHKIFKARYFPKNRFQEAKIGANPSFGWRGIWEAKEQLLKGCRWRVGDGKSINVWTDYWLPQHKLIPKPAETDLVHQHDTIECLIDGETQWWNVAKIQSLIPAQQAAEIFKILLSSEPILDCLIWEYEKSGVYSVKSGYKFFNSLSKDEQLGECSEAQNQRKF